MTLEDFYQKIHECIEFARENGAEIRRAGCGAVIGYRNLDMSAYAITGNAAMYDELLADCLREITNPAPIVKITEGYKS